MKLWILTSKLYTYEFNCFTNPSLLTLSLVVIPPYLGNIKYFSGKERCNSWAHSIFCMFVCLFFLNIIYCLQGREINSFNRGNACLESVGCQGRQELSWAQVRTSACFWGQIWFKTKTNNFPSVVLTPGQKKELS